eukprot:SAG31_NODE_177_length_21310_cov_8.894064_3_plen_1058_part_00
MGYLFDWLALLLAAVVVATEAVGELRDKLNATDFGAVGDVKGDDAAGLMWDPLALHLFVDEAGLSSTYGLHFVQHAPSKSHEMVVLPDKPWDGGGLKRGQIEGYGSLVQVSSSELRLYYMSMGAFGVGGAFKEYLCVTVSGDSGLTWEKPELGLVEFEGGTANNIVMQGGGASVFIDDNPRALPEERFKLVNDYWDPSLGRAGATMFASADGFNFTRMSESSSAAIFGSDTQNVVLWDPRAGNGSGNYVFYGRSHLQGGQNATCLSTKRPGRQVYEPKRSILYFEIGDRETLVTGPWPMHDADANATEHTILNADKFDPMCVDLYTSVATILGDAYFFFPQVDFHLDTHESQGRPNDGILEARMAVSRNSGDTPHYITRSAWLPRGAGQLRQGSTGVYEGSFDAGSTAVARGLVHVGDETWLMGYGDQTTHSGYLGVTAPPLKPLPPCRGSAGECPVQSGFQKLVLRKNGFISLSADNTVGQLTSYPFTLPKCGGANSSLVLQLNIEASVGVGAQVELHSAKTERLLGQSETILGGGVEFDVHWTKPPSNATLTKQWVNTGCAYEARLRNASLPQGHCDHGDYWHPCKTTPDCVCWSLGSASAYHCGVCKPWKGLPDGVLAECIAGICQTPLNISNMTGGEFCGRWEQVVQPPTKIGTDIRQLVEHDDEQVVMKIRLQSTNLYSSQFLCGSSVAARAPLKTTDSEADVMFWFYLGPDQKAWNYAAAANNNMTRSKFGRPPTSDSQPTASFSPFQTAYVVETSIDASPLVHLSTPPPWASQNETQSSESLLPLRKLGPLIVPITVAGRTSSYKSCDPNTNTSCLADLSGFLQSKSRRAAAIAELVALAKERNFSGFNFDQENMMPSATVHTSKALTIGWRNFIKELAAAMMATNAAWTVSVDICGCGGPIPLQRVSTFPDYMGMVAADWKGLGVETVSMCTYSNDSGKEYLQRYDVFEERLTCLHDSYGKDMARVGLFQGMGTWNPDVNELKRQLTRIAAANLTKLAIFNVPSLYSSVEWLDTIYDWVALRKAGAPIMTDDEDEKNLGRSRCAENETS